MAEAIQILLVEDELDVCDIYCRMLMKNDEMTIACATGSENEAWKCILNQHIDVIILDLELEEGDGLSFMFRLEEKLSSNKEKPLIFVVTNNSSRITWEMVMDHGADYVIQKNSMEYSPFYVLSKLEKAYPYYKNRDKSQPFLPNTIKVSNERMEEYVEEYLNNMCLIGPQNGILYLKDAIMMVIERNDDTDLHLSKDIYPVIGEKHHVSSSTVEKDIRRLVSLSWKKIEWDSWEKYFSMAHLSKTQKPTNTELIMNLAKHLRA